VTVTHSAMAAVFLISLASSVSAQSTADLPPDASAATAATAASAQEDDDPDRDINLAQPDFTLGALPTTLRVPRHKSSFRVTHRFARPLGRGDFGDLLNDLFGLDSGAVIGLEYRFGLFRGTQIGVHRTSGKTIQFFAQHNLVAQRDDFPLGIDIVAAVEGIDNFRDEHSPTIGVLLSREIGDRAAFYIEPMFVGNTNPFDVSIEPRDEHTFMVGLGTRIRIRPTTYLVLEGAPHSGHNNGAAHISAALEKRAGGHLFQLNFSNHFGTTFAQVARGGIGYDDWYMGFNISRKFF
jgi:hypothetical protein